MVMEWRSSKLQQLEILMQTYASKFDYNKEDLVKILYKKYNIESRTWLSDSELENLLDSYRISITSGVS